MPPEETTQPGIAHLGPSSGPLRARRCVRHEQREAVARCPRCTRYFCRECVSEHEGLLLCAECLEKQVAADLARVARPTRGLPAWVPRGVGSLAGFAALWLIFHLAGVLLLKIPPDLHHGKIWQQVAEGIAAP